MAKQQAEQEEIAALERRYWDAVRGRDAATASALSEDPCVVVGTLGIGEIDRKELAGMMAGDSYDLQEFDFGEVHVRRVAPDVAITAYRVDEKVRVDGENLALRVFDSSVWVRRDGKWRCALHTESPAGDPFGRTARSGAARKGGAHVEH
jgi:uncharacterized protein (TIGR02246 family)